MVAGLLVRVKLKSGADAVCEAVVFDMTELDELEEVAVVLEDVEVLEDEVVLTALAPCPGFG
jgi:hypothetical protein